MALPREGDTPKGDLAIPGQNGNCRWAKILRDQDGYMGIVPSYSKAGCSVHLLAGGDVPFIDSTVKNSKPTKGP
jgi:hypothetical protein